MHEKQYFVNVNGRRFKNFMLFKKDQLNILYFVLLPTLLFFLLDDAKICRCTVTSVISWLDQFIGKLPLVTAYKNHNI